ncbi:MAG: ATP-dependent endonuclease [Bacteroidetes bacterium GWF2_42_66]|nr:MAG: ATP-dependent endonuclease [Bacteroidetes bacterium GWA2_42_15]OFX98695.1 MAG: ATP-dependent endonuclease [Bacteroidetes bacterium GWE2_42_39]OFY43107.1 MAG: ATP-dependent endonuclease [Bacteroidetes bacterium GWF2_42_66]HBL77046.1 ATP-dependent endonuclease [Prolixibacteraceae bacterium]HCU59899.1 ATP-dependent endonuclease [Prolixibacteraceae bacterium]
MYISKLSIRNYRNFRNASLNFNKGVNTIIGENGSGKTNLFQAIRILIDESMPRVIKFYETDFNRSVGAWQGHWIIIQIQFSDLDVGEEAQSLAMHKVGHVDEVDYTTGSYTVYFRPRIEYRRYLFELSKELQENPDRDKSEDVVKLEAILQNITLNDYETIFTGRSGIDFSVENSYKEFVGDFELIKFPDPDELRLDIYGIRTQGVSIPNEFACTFAKALRDVESDLRSFKDNPLISLLRDKGKSIEILKKNSIEEKVKSLNDDISNLEEVKGVSLGISSTVKRAVGETYAPNVNIRSELPSEMERLLQSLKLWVGDPDEEGYEGKLGELSLGGANLIYLSLKLLEFEKVKKEDKIANFILIEEPEAHIHTHIQKTLFNKLKENNTQVFISTHSTHISSVSQISSMNILGRGKQFAEVFNPSINLDPIEIRKIERYLDANRTNLLFAKGVLLVEGDAEHIVIPALVKSVFGVSVDELGISIVNIGSTGFTNIAALFHEDRVRRNCGIITDNDLSIVELPENSETDNDYQKKCRNSEKSGIERRKKLDKFCEGNGWIKPFYAKHTFEVDFLMANNSVEVQEVVKDNFERDADRERIKELLVDENVAIAGKEVLRLAEKFGKGWFAVMLSEKVDHITVIPDYILDALAYTIPNLTTNIQFSIAAYRLKRLRKRHFTNDENDYSNLLREFENKEILKESMDLYFDTLPNDVFTKLVRLANA